MLSKKAFEQTALATKRNEWKGYLSKQFDQELLNRRLTQMNEAKRMNGGVRMPCLVTGKVRFASEQSSSACLFNGEETNLLTNLFSQYY